MTEQTTDQTQTGVFPFYGSAEVDRIVEVLQGKGCDAKHGSVDEFPDCVITDEKGTRALERRGFRSIS